MKGAGNRSETGVKELLFISSKILFLDKGYQNLLPCDINITQLQYPDENYVIVIPPNIPWLFYPNAEKGVL